MRTHASRPRHPVVRAYCETGADLRTILGSVPGSDTPILAAMRLLQDFVAGTHATKEAFQAADRVAAEGTDPDLLLLFLACWAHAAFVQAVNLGARASVPQAILHRANALATPDSPPAVVSYLVTIEAHLVGHAGDRARQEATLRAALALLPATAPRRGVRVLELAQLLAQGGRLQELDIELKRLTPSDRLAAIRFVDAVETGRFDAASEQLEPAAPPASDRAFAAQLAAYQRLLAELRTLQQTGVAATDTVTADGHLPDWALVLRFLGTDLHQALRWARVCERAAPQAVPGIGFLSFNLIRAELAESNVHAARRLLSLRRERGNKHYLDDLFLARIALLDGQDHDAVRHMARLFEAVDRYDAGARLGLELQLAVELPRDRLVAITRRAVRARLRPPSPKPAAADAADPAAPAPHTPRGADRLTGASKEIAAVRDAISRMAPLDVPVLITGETGTGKELAARALHEAGPRADEPFVAVNCGAIAESLLESELFGHGKGAFSGATVARAGLFEEAGRGTILLDEIGEISTRLQVALLRVLETREIRPVGTARARTVACRILAATNADLEQLAERGAFRRDLLFRLRRLEIHIPPLRERRGDLDVLAALFLNEGRAEGVHATISPALRKALRAQAWPGNVRELRNTIERMRLMNSDKLSYDATDLGTGRGAAGPADAWRLAPPPVRIEAPAGRLTAGRTMSASAPDEPTPRDSEEVLRHATSRVRRLARLRALFTQHELLTRGEIIRILGISPNTATRDLKTLREEGMVEKIQPSPSPRSAYFVLQRRT